MICWTWCWSSSPHFSSLPLFAPLFSFSFPSSSILSSHLFLVLNSILYISFSFPSLLCTITFLLSSYLIRSFFLILLTHKGSPSLIFTLVFFYGIAHINTHGQTSVEILIQINDNYVKKKKKKKKKKSCATIVIMMVLM